VIPYEWFDRAQERIRPHTVRTPLTHDAERGLFLKWENHQVTGSFKARGAVNKVLSLEDWERTAGLVAASAGNHGQGVALAGRLTRSEVEVFVPAHAVPGKVQAIQALGGKLHFVNGGYGKTEAAALEYARESGKTFISPYNDGQIIAGQGTIALEVVQQLEDGFQESFRDIAAWVFPTGGGGLVSGCAAALAGLGPRPTVFGVQPEASAFTYSLFHHQTQRGVRDDPTLADGLSGAIDEGSITIPMMKELVNDIVTASEEAIERAIAHAWWSYGEMVEGSAAAALAAVLEGTSVGRPCVVIMTGGNMQRDVFEQIIARHPLQVEK